MTAELDKRLLKSITGGVHMNYRRWVIMVGSRLYKKDLTRKEAIAVYEGLDGTVLGLRIHYEAH